MYRCSLTDEVVKGPRLLLVTERLVPKKRTYIHPYRGLSTETVRDSHGKTMMLREIAREDPISPCVYIEFLDGLRELGEMQRLDPPNDPRVRERVQQ